MEITNELVWKYVVYSYDLTKDWKYLDILQGDNTNFLDYEDMGDRILVDGLEHRLTIHKSDIKNWNRQSKLKNILEYGN